MQKARSSRPLGSQGAGEGGHELGSGVKVLHLYVRGEEESKGERPQRSECGGSRD